MRDLLLDILLLIVFSLIEYVFWTTIKYITLHNAEFIKSLRIQLFHLVVFGPIKNHSREDFRWMGVFVEFVEYPTYVKKSIPTVISRLFENGKDYSTSYTFNMGVIWITRWIIASSNNNCNICFIFDFTSDSDLWIRFIFGQCLDI